MNGITKDGGEDRSEASFIFEVSIITILSLFILLTITGLPKKIPMQAASWWVFLAILILPGYLLTSIFRFFHPLEFLERLALSLPVGMAAFSLPGLFVMVLHRTYMDLLIGWLATTTIIIVACLLFQFANWKIKLPKIEPWTVDELVLVGLLVIAFFTLLPILTSASIDGDLITYMSLVNDGFSGKPFGLDDPMFGSSLTPGLRVMFNQFIPLLTLWAQLSNITPIDLGIYASRSMFALWGLLAVFFLGKAAGNGSRRSGLVAACIQMLVYLAAPFFKFMNDSTFFLLRTNADKFTVTLTMLPIAFGLVIHYIREGKPSIWIIAALTSFAVSGIHPLISAMLTIGLAGFGGVHLLLNFRSRLAWIRVSLTGIIAVIALVLPLVLLVFSLTVMPMAPTFPSSFEGWSVNIVQAPALPFIRLPTLDWVGPLPDLSRLEPEDVDTTTNPFLIWRYSQNSIRQKFLVFSLDRYISNPSIILDPPYFLALLLSLVLLWRIKSNLGAQLAVGVNFAVVIALFNPILTPLMGKLVMPWILYRLTWMMPYAVIITLVLISICKWVSKIFRLLFRSPSLSMYLDGWLPVILLVIAVLPLQGSIRANLREKLHYTTLVSRYPQPTQLLATLSRLVSTEEVMVAADQSMSVTIPAYISNASIIAHRVNNTSESFPADQQDIALARMIDQYDLFNTPYLTENSIQILLRYGVDYIIVRTDDNLNCQFQLANGWFEWVLDDGDYSLYAVNQIPQVNDSIRGLTALNIYDPDRAEEYFRAALQQDDSDMLAQAGLAMVYRMRGQTNQALEQWEAIASVVPSASVYEQIGRVYQGLNYLKASQKAYEQAVLMAPEANVYHWRLGDTFAGLEQVNSAEAEYRLATRSILDEAPRLVIIGDHWRSQNKDDLAENHYRQSLEIRDSMSLQIQLAIALQNQGEFNQAEKILEEARQNNPGYSEVFIPHQANLLLEQGKYDQAIELHNELIWMQDLKITDSAPAQISKISTLLGANRLEDAEEAILKVLRNNPFNLLAYIHAANLMLEKGETTTAAAAFDKALEINPYDIGAYYSLYNLSNELPTLGDSLALADVELDVTINQPHLFMLQGNQFLDLGATPMAITAYQTAMEMLERSKQGYWEGIDFVQLGEGEIEQMKAIIYNLLGSSYEELGLVDRVMPAFQTAVALDPDNAWHLIELGNAFYRRYDSASAEDLFKQAIQLDQTRLDGYISLVDLYQKMGKVELAAQYLDEAVDVFQSQTDQPLQVKIRLANSTVSNSSVVFGELYGSESIAESPALNLMLTAGITNLAELIQTLEGQSQHDDVLALALIYRLTLQLDAGIAFLQEQISLAERNNLPASILADYYSNLGDLLFAKDQNRLAGEAYNRALTLNPQSAPANIGYIEVLLRSGQTDLARGLIEDLIASSTGSIELQLPLAELLFQIGDLQRSARVVEELLDNHLGNPTVLNALARAYFRIGDLTAAEEIYLQALENTPSDADAYLGLSEVHMAQGRMKDAEENLLAAIRVDYTFTDGYLALGQLSMHRAQYQEANEWYRQAALISPWNPGTTLGLAESYRQLGDHREAEAVLLRASEQDQLSGEALLALADLYLEQGQHEQVESALLTIVSTPSGNEIIPVTGQHEQAEVALQESFQSDGYALEAHLALANYYQQRGHTALSLKQLQLAMDAFPASPEAHALYAEQMRQMGHTEEALEWLGKAQQVILPTPRGFRLLAATYQELEQTDQAYEMIEQAISLDPGAWANLLQKAAIQQKIGDFPTALLTLQNAASLAPLQGQVWQALGELQFAHDQSDAAEAAWKQAIAVEPAHLPPYGLLADLYQQVGNTEQAKAILMAARETAPNSYLVDLYIAEFEEKDGNWQAAEAALQQAIQKAPGRSAPYEALFSLMLTQQQFEQAKYYLKQALQIEPNSDRLLNALINVNYLIIEPFYKAPIVWAEGTRTSNRTQMVLELENIFRGIPHNPLALEWVELRVELKRIFGSLENYSDEIASIRTELTRIAQDTHQMANRISDIEAAAFSLHHQHQNEFINRGVRIEPQTLFWPSYRSIYSAH